MAWEGSASESSRQPTSGLCSIDRWDKGLRKLKEKKKPVCIFFSGETIFPLRCLVPFSFCEVFCVKCVYLQCLLWLPGAAASSRLLSDVVYRFCAHFFCLLFLGPSSSHRPKEPLPPSSCPSYSKSVLCSKNFGFFKEHGNIVSAFSF